MRGKDKADRVRKFKAEALGYLKTVEEADDLDLWEEMIGKMFDVVLVYRRSQEAEPKPTAFTFSDGVTRDLTAMTASHAVAEMHPDLDGDEFPAFLCRGEHGA